MDVRPGFIRHPISFTTPARTYDLGYTQIPRDTVLLAFRGSVAHGMFVDPETVDGIDDVDLVGLVVPQESHYLGLSSWGSSNTKDFVEGIWDGVYYEMSKAIRLLLQGNPNILSLLWIRPEHYLEISEVGQMLIDNRNLFVGSHVYASFAGYASAQLQKMESRDPADLRDYLAVTAELKYRGAHPNEKGEVTARPYPMTYPHADDYMDDEDMRKANGECVRTHAGNEAYNIFCTSTEKLLQKLKSYQKKGENIGYMGDKRKRLVLDVGYDAKNAAHCIRLLRMCKEFMQTGAMTVHRADAGDAAELLDIKRGKWTLQAIKAHAEELFAEIRELKEKTELPPEPNKAEVEKLLIRMIRAHWDSCRKEWDPKFTTFHLLNDFLDKFCMAHGFQLRNVNTDSANLIHEYSRLIPEKLEDLKNIR